MLKTYCYLPLERTPSIHVCVCFPLCLQVTLNGWTEGQGQLSHF